MSARLQHNPLAACLIRKDEAAAAQTRTNRDIPGRLEHDVPGLSFKDFISDGERDRAAVRKVDGARGSACSRDIGAQLAIVSSSRVVDYDVLRIEQQRPSSAVRRAGIYSRGEAENVLARNLDEPAVTRSSTTVRADRTIGARYVIRPYNHLATVTACDSIRCNGHV